MIFDVEDDDGPAVEKKKEEEVIVISSDEEEDKSLNQSSSRKKRKRDEEEAGEADEENEIVEASPISEDEESVAIDAHTEMLRLDFGTKLTIGRMCFMCGGADHVVRDCPKSCCERCGELKRKNQRCKCLNAKNKDSDVCEWCRKFGHEERNCPTKQMLLTQEIVAKLSSSKGSQFVDFSAFAPNYAELEKERKKVRGRARNPQGCFNCGRDDHDFSSCDGETVEDLWRKFPPSYFDLRGFQ